MFDSGCDCTRSETHTIVFENNLTNFIKMNKDCVHTHQYTQKFIERYEKYMIENIELTSLSVANVLLKAGFKLISFCHYNANLDIMNALDYLKMGLTKIHFEDEIRSRNYSIEFKAEKHDGSFNDIDLFTYRYDENGNFTDGQSGSLHVFNIIKYDIIKKELLFYEDNNLVHTLKAEKKEAAE